MNAPLVLSLFPGIGLLDMAFEEEGFCVVRGPDLLWGGDVRRFHPPAGRFDGVIGGPPCQMFSPLRNFAHRWKRQPENLIPEFERCVSEAHPRWFIMENVSAAPVPQIMNPRYEAHSFTCNNRDFGAEQTRERRFSVGSANGHLYAVQRYVAEAAMAEPTNGNWSRAVTAANGGGRMRMQGPMESLSVEEALRRQGAPDDFFGDRSPFSRKAQLKMVAQGVPLPMGRAVARAVKRAMYPEQAGAA